MKEVLAADFHHPDDAPFCSMTLFKLQGFTTSPYIKHYYNYYYIMLQFLYIKTENLSHSCPFKKNHQLHNVTKGVGLITCWSNFL